MTFFEWVIIFFTIIPSSVIINHFENAEFLSTLIEILVNEEFANLLNTVNTHIFSPSISRNKDF